MGDVERGAVTGEKIQGTVIPQQNGDGKTEEAPKKLTNAFTALMNSKPKLKHEPPPQYKPKQTVFQGRQGLGAYTAEPSAFGPEVMIYYNDFGSMIYDAFPKSSIHTLLLPANTERHLMHPFDAFDDPDFLAATKLEVQRAKEIVASEMRRRYGRFSASDAPRLAAMEADDVPDELPAGRDWLSEVRSGIHAHPSMAHLHVHVFSPDMSSPQLNHRRHYETFNTDFLVPLEQFPLAKDDHRRQYGASGLLGDSLICWRCGGDFGNSFKKLKEHLAEEFEAWKKV